MSERHDRWYHLRVFVSVLPLFATNWMGIPEMPSSSLSRGWRCVRAAGGLSLLCHDGSLHLCSSQPLPESFPHTARFRIGRVYWEGAGVWMEALDSDKFTPLNFEMETDVWLVLPMAADIWLVGVISDVEKAKIYTCWPGKCIHRDRV